MPLRWLRRAQALVSDALTMPRSVCSRLQVTPFEAIPLAVTAGRFSFPTLQAQCERALVNSFTRRRALQVLLSADMFSPSSHLAALKFVFGEVRTHTQGCLPRFW